MTLPRTALPGWEQHPHGHGYQRVVGAYLLRVFPGADWHWTVYKHAEFVARSGDLGAKSPQLAAKRALQVMQEHKKRDR